MDVPHEVVDAEPRCGGDDLGVVDEHDVVVAGLVGEQPTGRAEGLAAGAPGGVREVDGAQTGHVRQVEPVRDEGGGIRDPHAGVEERADLAVADPGVLRVVHDGDDEGAQGACGGTGAHAVTFRWDCS